MEYASSLFLGSAQTSYFNIIDGQNSEAIANSTGGTRHPCLIKHGDSNNKFIVTFSPNITSFTDWFPPICSSLNSSDYDNEYMFDDALNWKFHNLIVENYKVSEYYPIARTSLTHGSTIQCDYCIFKNVTDDTTSGMSLFYSYRRLYFSHSEFIGVTTTNDAMITSSNNDAIQDNNRTLEVVDCVFSELDVVSAVFYLSGDVSDVK